MSYRWLEHTSELELQIEAPSEREVFALAVAAIGELVASESGQEGSAQAGHDGDGELAREVTASAADRAALLAAFLEELVYLIETDDLVPQRIEQLELAEGRVTAIVHGYRGRPRHLIKGVTYHELAFAPHPDGFAATVVLDV